MCDKLIYVLIVLLIYKTVYIIIMSVNINLCKFIEKIKSNYLLI